MRPLPDPISNFGHADQRKHVWDANDNSESY